MKFLFDSHIAFLSLSIDSPSIVFRVCLNWKSNDTKRNTIATKALVFTPFSKFPFYFFIPSKRNPPADGLFTIPGNLENEVLLSVAGQSQEKTSFF